MRATTPDRSGPPRLNHAQSGSPRRPPSTAVDRVARLVIALAVLALVGWGLGALCRSLLTTIDLRVVHAVASERTPAQTTTAYVLSSIGSGYVIFPLALVSCAILCLGARRWRTLAVGAGTLGAVAIANLDKLLVGRPRPPVHHMEKVTSYSFPSGHSAQSAALVTALVVLMFATNRPGWLKITAAAAGFVLVAGIATSRVYLGVHYPSDVVVGALLGSGWALIAAPYITAPAALASPGLEPPRRPAAAGSAETG